MCCCAVVSTAQQAWTVFDSNNSLLPENSVRCLTIDSAGIVWVGTDYGLASFNNGTWNVYYTFNSALPDNAIRSLDVDQNGHLWVGTFSNGVAKFDGISWVSYNTQNSPLPDDYVRSIAIDTLGTKWFGTIGGLAEFDDNNWIIHTITTASIGSNNIGALKVNKLSNDLAVGTINGGMTLVSGGNWNEYNIWNSNIPDNTLLGFAYDSSQTLWMVTPASGLSAHLGGFAFFTQNTFSSGIQSNSLSSIDIYRPLDQHWIGSLDSGVIRKSGNLFTAFHPGNSPMPDYFVQSVKVASDGVVWIGTQTGGLVRLDPALLTSASHNTYSEIEWNIYPNPAGNHLYLSSNEKCVIRISDGVGKTMLKYELNIESGSQSQVDISHLKPGVYNIYFQTDSGKSGTTILVVQK
jgi:ligand-binding sensor domain-containing protein